MQIRDDDGTLRTTIPLVRREAAKSGEKEKTIEEETVSRRANLNQWVLFWVLACLAFIVMISLPSYERVSVISALIAGSLPFAFPPFRQCSKPFLQYLLWLFWRYSSGLCWFLLQSPLGRFVSQLIDPEKRICTGGQKDGRRI